MLGPTDLKHTGFILPVMILLGTKFEADRLKPLITRHILIVMLNVTLTLILTC